MAVIMNTQSGFPIGVFFLGGACLVMFNMLFYNPAIFISFFIGTVCSGLFSTFFFTWICINGYQVIFEKFGTLVVDFFRNRDMPKILAGISALVNSPGGLSPLKDLYSNVMSVNKFNPVMPDPRDITIPVFPFTQAKKEAVRRRRPRRRGPGETRW